MPRARKARKKAESVIPKETLAKEIARIVDDGGLTQTEAAELLDDAASQVSLVVNGRVAGFSPERLMRMLTGLGRDVDIVIRRARRRSGKVRVTVR